MIRYQLTVGRRTVSVILDVGRPDQAEAVRYEGASADVEVIASRLHVSHGRFGYLIGERTTAEDLEAAMGGRWLAPFAPKKC